MNFGLRKYQGKSGIKKLFNLLVEEFGGETAGKRQIALLFALLDSQQPVENIKALMGETDNSSIVRYVCTAVLDIFTCVFCLCFAGENNDALVMGARVARSSVCFSVCSETQCVKSWTPINSS